MKTARALLEKQLQKRSHYTEASLVSYMLLTMLALVAAAVQLLLALLYSLAGCPPLALCLLAGALLCLLGVPAAQHSRFAAATGVICGVVLANSLIAGYLVGRGPLPVLFPLMVLQIVLVLPFRSRTLQVGLGCLAMLCAVGTHLLAVLHPNLFELGAWALPLACLSIEIISVGMAAIFLLWKKARHSAGDYLRRKMDTLQEKAYLDALTGLFNRRFADVYLRNLVSTPTPGSSYVAMVDIDDFKQVNDTFGHAAGDAVLRRVGGILKDHTRKTDMAARWGGEEFLVVLKGTASENAVKVLDKIRRLVEEEAFRHQDQDIRVTITIGAAATAGGNIQKCISNADGCLYTGKSAGKNRVVMH